jgi:hypothetical protein
MAREIPEVVRAAAGLAATVLDEARKLPETLPGLTVRVVGLAMQTAMKVQQQYAELVARGDELFTGIRGEDEPGLATFDDDEPAATPGFRDSAFDRAGAAEAEEARVAIEVLVDEAPATEDLLDELAIEEMVGDVPTPEEALPEPPASPREAPARKSPPRKTAARKAAAAPEPAPAPAAEPVVEAEPTADVATPVDELTSAGEEAAVDAAVADEIRAAAESPAAEAPAPEARTPATPVAALVVAPVDGYDDFSIAQLRGRLRGYAGSTVQELLDYEQATRARDPYLTMLRNRLEKLDEQAVEASPLAPRGT